jgi:hypothetical protein
MFHEDYYFSYNKSQKIAAYVQQHIPQTTKKQTRTNGNSENKFNMWMSLQ